jgi:hypothetical protein
MSTVRRRILRPELPAALDRAADHRRRQAAVKAQRQLERERVSLAHWMTRLRRAFHSVERGQLRVSRLERKLAQLEQS